MSKPITLEEVANSPQIRKQINIIDFLTRETSDEHGFIFCKPDNDIVVDKLCVGDVCGIDIGAKECTTLDNTFHSHPEAPGRPLSELSVPDFHMMAVRSFHGKKPNISCVKTVGDEEVLCKRIDLSNFKEFPDKANEYLDDFDENPTYENSQRLKLKMNELLKPDTIIFNNETGKVSKKSKKPGELIKIRLVSPEGEEVVFDV